MEKKKKSWRVAALAAVFATATLPLPSVARADQFGVQVAGGMADHHVNKLDLAAVWDPGLNWWYIGDWHFTVVGEGHVSWWHTSEGNVHENIGEVGLTPVLRFIKGSGWFRPYFEAGVGVRLLTSPTISTSYKLSTAFQFADMVGVGAQFGSHQQYQAGYRFQHLSNASIKEPNPGINFSQLYLQYNF
ncbi:acyloxyacyl hydrolase [Paraburkholderia sp.]|uniref:acyloxyacyl hydrolase n=1 Tax=Paraburkholderia sp. TaxID=1926495 RepID=UPI00239D3636|nr:acyloxyacyl hydrolase [Paraburkholderia sp.]MDE1178958.1 acyloxyacyl hydrolase [Paraburkholderia sp.]